MKKSAEFSESEHRTPISARVVPNLLSADPALFSTQELIGGTSLKSLLQFFELVFQACQSRERFRALCVEINVIKCEFAAVRI
jgi:hypothetical protein